MLPSFQSAVHPVGAQALLWAVPGGPWRVAGPGNTASRPRSPSALPGRRRARAAAAAGPVSVALRRALRVGPPQEMAAGSGAGSSGWGRPGGLSAA